MHSRNLEGFQCVGNPKNRRCWAVARMERKRNPGILPRAPVPDYAFASSGLQAYAPRIHFGDTESSLTRRAKQGHDVIVAKLRVMVPRRAVERHAEDTKKKTEDLSDFARL